MTNITNLFNRMNYCIPSGIGTINRHLTADGYTVHFTDTDILVYIFDNVRIHYTNIVEIVRVHNENLLLGINYIDYNMESKRILNQHYIKLGLSDEEAIKRFALMGFS